MHESASFRCIGEKHGIVAAFYKATLEYTDPMLDLVCGVDRCSKSSTTILNSQIILVRTNYRANEVCPVCSQFGRDHDADRHYRGNTITAYLSAAFLVYIKEIKGWLRVYDHGS